MDVLVNNAAIDGYRSYPTESDAQSRPGFVSDDGMFAERQRSSGVEVCKLLGTSRSEHVASAVVRALREDRSELLVNPGPMRAIQALNAFNRVQPRSLRQFT